MIYENGCTIFDDDGNVVDVWREKVELGKTKHNVVGEPVEAGVIKVPQDFFAKAAQETKLAALAATDGGVIRGVDDLWALLVSKGVLRAEDVPAELKAKLDARVALRADLSLIQTAEK